MNPVWILEKSFKKYVIEVNFTRGVGISSVSAHREVYLRAQGGSGRPG